MTEARTGRYSPPHRTANRLLVGLRPLGQVAEPRRGERPYASARSVRPRCSARARGATLTGRGGRMPKGEPGRCQCLRIMLEESGGVDRITRSDLWFLTDSASAPPDQPPGRQARSSTIPTCSCIPDNCQRSVASNARVCDASDDHLIGGRRKGRSLLGFVSRDALEGEPPRVRSISGLAISTALHPRASYLTS